MNILITGASGFLGKSLLKCIKEDNFFEDSQIILLSSHEIEGYKCILHKNYTFTKQDFISQGIDNIDVVLHIGAATLKTREEYKNIDCTYKFVMNVRNTIHLLENLPNVPSKFIFTSSEAVYKSAQYINESTKIQTEEMYGASKFMCEKYLEKLANDKDFILQILRLGPIYGPGEETYSKIVSGFMKKILNDEQITIFGDGSDKRSMLYVDDCCKAILEAVKFDKYIGPVNIASSQVVTIKELVDIIYSVTKKEPQAIYGEKQDSKNTIFDTAKMQKYFNIQEIPFEKGVENFYKYYTKKINIGGSFGIAK